MYLNYKNSKVTIADYDPAQGPAGSDKKEFLAQSVNLDIQANISAQYVTEERYSHTFVPEQGINGTLSFDYFLTGADPLKDYIINDSGAYSKYRTLSGNFGGLNFSSGYLINYAANFSPNEPIRIKAAIRFFDALSGQHTSTNLSAVDTPTLNVQDVTITSSEEGSESQEIKPRVDSIRNISYQYQSEIEASYRIGETVPENVIFGPKTVQATLEVDSLSGDLPVYGKPAHFLATLVHPFLSSVTETFPVSGVISQRNIRSTVGDLISTSLTIKQSFFGECPTVTNVVGAHAWDSAYQITGTNFVDVSKVKIGSNPVKSFSVQATTGITFVIPLGITSNVITVYTEACPYGVSTASATITDLGISVTGYYKSDGITESYTGRYLEKIVVKGQYFDEVDRVYFKRDTGPQGTTQSSDTEMPASFELISDGPSSELRATIPQNCISGHIHLKSTTRNLSNTNNSHMLRRHFVPFPVIDSYSFTKDGGLPGGVITINGNGFVGGEGFHAVGLTGAVNNLPLSPLSGVTSSGVANVSVSGERVGSTKLLIGLPKIEQGYAGGPIKISGESGVYAISDIDFEPLVYITGISGDVHSSSLTHGHPASGTVGTDIIISGGNFYEQLLHYVTPHSLGHAGTSFNAWVADYNGVTGIVYPSGGSSTTVLTGTIPYGARSGTLGLFDLTLNTHPSGMDFSPVLPAPVIKSIMPHSGIAGNYVTLSGNYFANADVVKLVKRSTSKHGDEILSGILMADTTTKNAAPPAGTLIGLKHAGVSGFSLTLDVATDSDGKNADLITFKIPTGFRGGSASSSTAGTAGTYIPPPPGTNWLFTGHGIYDVVLENNRGNYTVSGSTASGLVVMGTPMPRGCYVNVDSVASVHNDIVRHSLSGAPGTEVFISGHNLYPGSLVYINDNSSVGALGIPTTSYSIAAPVSEVVGQNHATSGQYTGLSFIIPSRTGAENAEIISTGVKFYVQTPKASTDIKAFEGVTWPHKNVTSDNDIFLFLRPTISGFEPVGANEGDLITVSGAFLTGVNSVKLGGESITAASNYLKTKHSSLSATWQSTALTTKAIETSIYGTSLTFHVPTGTLGGQIEITATGGLVTSTNALTITDPIPVINGFTPTAADSNTRVYVSGRNLDYVDRAYVSGIIGEDVLSTNTNTSEAFREIEVPTTLASDSATGLYFNTPSNLAKSGYIKLVSKNGEQVLASQQLFLTRIEKISPQLEFMDRKTLDDTQTLQPVKIHAQGINLNYPGVDIRFRGVDNPLGKRRQDDSRDTFADMLRAQDFRFVKPSGGVDSSNVEKVVKYQGNTYMSTTWGKTGAYFFSNRETQCDSMYLVSGGAQPGNLNPSGRTKANGPHETFFINSHGMVVGKSPMPFIPQPEISGEIRQLTVTAGQAYSANAPKLGTASNPIAINKQFFMTGLNCFNVSKHLIGTHYGGSVKIAGVTDNKAPIMVQKYITKELSGFHTNVNDKYYPYQGASYKDSVTGSLSGTLTGTSITNWDAGYVILSGTIGEGLNSPLGLIDENIILSLCSTCDPDCNLDEGHDAPDNGSLPDLQGITCFELEQLISSPEGLALLENTQFSIISQELYKQECL
mgnify:CR=1 FL=1